MATTVPPTATRPPSVDELTAQVHSPKPCSQVYRTEAPAPTNPSEAPVPSTNPTEAPVPTNTTAAPVGHLSEEPVPTNSTVEPVSTNPTKVPVVPT
jgi:hypothetical protein